MTEQQFKRCDSCGIVQRTDADVCDALQPGRELTERNGHVWRGPADGRPYRCGGTLTITDGCHAVIFHGPGHQSTTRCERVDDHDVHGAALTVSGQYAQWRGMESSTGFFDEAPEID